MRPCMTCRFAWCRPSDRLSGLEPNDAPRQDTRTRRERPFDSARAGVTFITGQNKPKSIIRAHRNLHARDRFPHTDLKTVLSEVLSALSRSEQQASGDGASFEKVQTLKRWWMGALANPRPQPNATFSLVHISSFLRREGVSPMDVRSLFGIDPPQRLP